MKRTHSKAVFSAILIFIFLAGAFFYIEYSRHQALVIQEETSETERLLYHLQNYIENMEEHLLLIANMWKKQSPGEQKDQFLVIAEEMTNLFPAYRFIHFIDNDLIIRYSAPQEQALSIGLIGKDTSQDSENIMMFKKMMETPKPLLSPAIWREISEAYGAHIWAPVLEGPDLLGIISGDLDLSYIISEKIKKLGLSHHSIRINVSNLEIFRTDERQTYPVEITHEIMDIPWTIGVSIDETMSLSIMFLSGALLSLLVSFSVYKMLIKNRLLEETRDDLQDREENLSVTLQSIGDGMIATDTKGLITRMNPAAEELTGYLIKEALGRRIEEVFTIFNAKTGEPAVNPVQQVLETGKVVGLANDTRLIRRDGAYLQISDSAAPIKDHQERVKGVVLVFSDVTEQYRSQEMVKESEAKYRKSEERFQRMLSVVPDMISIHDSDMNIIYSNWNGFGKVIEEKRVLNTKCYRTYRGLENICPDCQAITVLQTKESFQKEVELPEGMWIDLRVIPLLGDDGSVELFIEWVKDITERKQMEEKIRESEEKHRRLFETMAQGVIYQAADGAIVSANPAAERLLGLSFQEMQGKTSMDPRWQMIKEDGTPVPGTEHPAIIALKTGKKVDPVVRGVFHPVKNTYIWLNIIAIPLFQPDETEPFQAYATFEDITRRKQIEETLKKSEQEKALILNNVSHIIAFHDKEHRIIWANKAYVQGISSATGIPTTLDELKGKKCYEAWGLKKLCNNCPVSLAIKTGSLQESELTPQNQEIWPISQGMWNVRAAPILDSSGVITGAIEFGIDITTSKQHEKELIEYSQEVERLNQHLNQEIEKANRIHNNILPKEFPNVKEISIAAFYQPADKLGGDFYDVIQADNKLVMYLSDISGHGLDGGMINFFVKEAIDSYIALKPEELSPRNILRHLERQFRQKNHPDEIFICIFMAVLDLETMELTYTGAGFQDAPLVSQGYGEQAMLSTKGLFINSVFPIDKNNFLEKTISLTKGSSIFFNTDGLTEQNEQGAFYRDRLPQVFYKNAHLLPEEISQAVVEDFRQFNNGSLQGDDDITFLIVQVEPENKKHEFVLTTDFNELENLQKKAVAILPNIQEADVLIGCLYELAANAMEHGNQMDPKKRVFLEAMVSTEYLLVSVEDEGAGFNWRNKVRKPLELEGYTERGRGIAMARMLCDSLYYNDKGNKVTCVVKTV